jgi:hypothetical protein
MYASRLTARLANLSIPFLLASVLPGQIGRVIPAVKAAAEGNVNLELPFWYDAGRVQLVVDGTSVTATAAFITSASFRPAGADTTAFPARTLANVTISAGHAAAGVGPTTMSGTFTNNRGPGFATMFNGQLSLPAQTGFQSPAPFNVVLPFPQPFFYQRSMGNFLVELEMPGSYTTIRFYTPLDGEMYRGSWGAWGPYGTAGTLNNGGRPGLESFVNGSTLIPGGTLRTTVRAGGPFNPVLVWLGASIRDFRGLAIPFDLTALGAPGNYLLASMDLIVVTALQQAGSSWSAHVDWPIPNRPEMAGATVYAQAALRDAQANALGWVFTFGSKVLVAPGGARAVEHNMLYHHDPSYPVGYFPLLTMGQGPGAGGPVLELRGVFQ